MTTPEPPQHDPFMPPATAPEQVPDTNPSAPSTLKDRLRPWLLPAGIGAAGLIVGFVLGAVTTGSSDDDATAGTPAGARTFTLTGTMTLNDADNINKYVDSVSGARATYGDCLGKGGYKDLHAGASVTVYDSTGAVIATGSLGAAKWGGSAQMRCEWPVAVPDVPAGRGFYQVEVSHRGKLKLSEAEAKAGGFGGSIG
ncbi:hypothetical protein ACODT3_37005 [Streptomyces sp. 4.24]|uniref:hypothetical protein n=1 Tax=Streptomyces tritrimontium TaxID=3406573 RepID=UPI003BB4C07A